MNLDQDNLEEQISEISLESLGDQFLADLPPLSSKMKGLSYNSTFSDMSDIDIDPPHLTLSKT